MILESITTEELTGYLLIFGQCVGMGIFMIRRYSKLQEARAEEAKKLAVAQVKLIDTETRISATIESRPKPQKRFDSSKNYEPIPGIRYSPGWYLKDPLPRNVRPKESTAQSHEATLVEVKALPPAPEDEKPTPGIYPPDFPRVEGTNTGDTDILEKGLRLIGKRVQPLGHRGLYMETKTFEKTEIQDLGTGVKALVIANDAGDEYKLEPVQVQKPY